MMRAVVVENPGKPFKTEERAIPEPAPGTVRLRVGACGICHSDTFVKEGHWPGLACPRVPGHEVAGVIDAIGPEVEGWVKGDRAGIGWHGDNCGICEPCRRGRSGPHPRGARLRRGCAAVRFRAVLV